MRRAVNHSRIGRRRTGIGKGVHFIGHWLACGMLISFVFFEPVSFPADALSESTAKRVEVQKVKLRGRIVCLVEELHAKHDVELPSDHQHLWALKSQDGKLFTILRGRFSDAIFMDPQVRSKELILAVRLFSEAQAIEVTEIQTVRNGIICELYYYCDVCSIKSISPEICACCREPVRLVEEPVPNLKK